MWRNIISKYTVLMHFWYYFDIFLQSTTFIFVWTPMVWTVGVIYSHVCTLAWSQRGRWLCQVCQHTVTPGITAVSFSHWRPLRRTVKWAPSPTEERSIQGHVETRPRWNLHTDLKAKSHRFQHGVKLSWEYCTLTGNSSSN